MMAREKQIEEMAKDLCNVCERINDCKFVGYCLHVRVVARDMYDNKGYRKTSEVAREIFEEIEKLVSTNEKTVGCATYEETIFYIEDFIEDLAELKKKYTGEKEDGKVY